MRNKHVRLNSQVHQGLTHTVACRSIGPVKNSELTPCRRRSGHGYTDDTRT